MDAAGCHSFPQLPSQLSPSFNQHRRHSSGSGDAGTKLAVVVLHSALPLPLYVGRCASPRQCSGHVRPSRVSPLACPSPIKLTPRANRLHHAHPAAKRHPRLSSSLPCASSGQARQLARGLRRDLHLLAYHGLLFPLLPQRLGARDDSARRDRNDRHPLRQDACQLTGARAHAGQLAHGQSAPGGDELLCCYGAGMDVRPRIIFCDRILSPWYIASTPRHSTTAVAKQPIGTRGFRPPNMFCVVARKTTAPPPVISRWEIAMRASCGEQLRRGTRGWLDAHPCHRPPLRAPPWRPDRRLPAPTRTFRTTAHTGGDTLQRTS